MDFEIVALPESYALAHIIAHKLGKVVIKPLVQEFADKEIEVKCRADQLSRKRIVLIHAGNGNVHDSIMRFSLLVHALKAVEVNSITAVIPYLWYTRHEKSAIDGKHSIWHMIARIIEATGISALIAVEIHAPTCVEIFNIPVYHVKLYEIIGEHIKTYIPENKQLCFVAPDEGASERARQVSTLFNASVIVFQKKRSGIEKTMIIGASDSCKQDTAIVIDDILATGGTAISASHKLHEMGVETLYGYFAHPILSGNALEAIERSAFKKIFVSNSIPHVFNKRSKIEVFDISKALSEMIQKVIKKG